MEVCRMHQIYLYIHIYIYEMIYTIKIPEPQDPTGFKAVHHQKTILGVSRCIQWLALRICAYCIWFPFPTVVDRIPGGHHRSAKTFMDHFFWTTLMCATGFSFSMMSFSWCMLPQVCQINSFNMFQPFFLDLFLFDFIWCKGCWFHWGSDPLR